MPVKRNYIKYKIINIKKTRNVRSINLLLDLYVSYLLLVRVCCFLNLSPLKR